MKVFDFDNTIYDGESSIDFFMYVVNKNKYYTRYIPITAYALTLYKANLLSLKHVQKIADRYAHEITKNKEDAEEMVKEFWKLNNQKLKQNMLDIITEEDVIITASPNILIDGIKNKLKTKNIICSKINLDTGELEFLCMGTNKELAFNQKYPNTLIDELYTDSMNDIPLINIAKKAYIVKGNDIIEIGKRKKKKRK